MIEKAISYKKSEQKLIEKLINDENVLINHVILARDDKIPEHYSDSHVNLLIIKGTMTLRLGEEAENQYDNTNIIQVPYNTKMNICNKNDDLLEFFIIKAPSPRSYSPKIKIIRR